MQFIALFHIEQNNIYLKYKSSLSPLTFIYQNYLLPSLLLTLTWNAHHGRQIYNLPEKIFRNDFLVSL